ncbi:tyrosine-type recombinase/integrase [Actinopolyspora halophila]|uniref:tyrosine-type recombinase/integrase n=1 Tax=Actinopolyspora halophila TaxID=1850 RepID=UPI0003657BA5|nr:tyrosine-type recombinase/integrase [Actinopolyspora halophila]
MARRKREDGRAPNGAGSIYYSETDDNWHGRVTMGVRDDGRPDRRHVRGRTEAEVTRKVRRLERERDDGKAQKPGKSWTVEKWLRHWLEHIAAPSVRPKTEARYRTSVEQYLIPGLGAHRADRLQPEHIEKLYGKLQARGLASSTVHHVHRTLRVALNEAVKRQHITSNPVLIAKAPKLTEPEIEPFTVHEARQILEVAQQRRNGARFAVALSLGLRQGEVLGLKWSDLQITWHHGCGAALTDEQREAINRLAKGTPQDWEHIEDEVCGNGEVADCPHAYPTATLTIRRALQRQTWRHGCGEGKPCGRKRGADCPQGHGGGLVVVETKSRSGKRVISLPEQLIHALLDHDEAQDEERHTARELWHDEGWMFAQPNGKAIDPRADYADWRALLDAANVRPARLHDARHTAATMLLVLQVPTRAIMEVMGWSEASMLTRYVHVPDEIKQGIAGQLGGLLWKPRGER